MATKAYFMVDVKEGFFQDGQMEDIVADLETIPEVKCVEPVNGVCDLLIEIEAPIRVVFVANKVLAKEWVKHLRVLKVEPFLTSVYEKLAVRHILKARSSHPQLLKTNRYR